MKDSKVVHIFIFLALLAGKLYAQELEKNSNFAGNYGGKGSKGKWALFSKKMQGTPWVIGHGWNIVHDDAGKWFKNLFNTDKAWNMTPYPLRLTCEKWLYSNKDSSGKARGWSIEFMGAYNRYGTGNYLVDRENPILVPMQYKLFSFDLHAKYNFNKLLDLNKLMGAKKEIFQPYGTFGLGYTYRTLPAHPNTVSLNVGLGFNMWIYKGWGVQIQGLAKFGLKDRFPNSGSNYLQHSIGVVYQFSLKPSEKGHMNEFFEEMKETPWVFGHGWNIVQDDAGKWFKNLFNVDKAWNMAPYPVRFTCEKWLYSNKDTSGAARGWSIELMGAYNRYGVGNFLVDQTNPVLVDKEYQLLSFDIHAKYNFNKLLDLNKLMGSKKDIIQPYGTFGFGYTYRSLPSHPGCGTVNAGLGLNVWIYKGIGIQIQSIAKFGLEDRFPNAGSNYLQHSISVVYKLDGKAKTGGNRYKFKKHNIKKVL